MSAFSEQELAELTSERRLARIATVGADGPRTSFPLVITTTPTTIPERSPDSAGVERAGRRSCSAPLAPHSRLQA
jgi:hypothetical protein